MVKNSEKSSGSKATETRQDRLKKALKANLQRRKAQARARDAAPTAGETGKDD